MIVYQPAAYGQLAAGRGFGDIPAAAAKSLQSCPTLCDPIDSLLPGSSVPGILQARILEWVAISFSNPRLRRSVVSNSQRPHGLQPTRLFRPWNFPGLPKDSCGYDSVLAYCLWLASCRQGIWGHSQQLPKPFEDPSCFSPAQHWLPTYAFSWRDGNLPLGRTDELQDWVSPPVCIQATFPFVSGQCYMGILPMGFECS